MIRALTTLSFTAFTQVLQPRNLIRSFSSRSSELFDNVQRLRNHHPELFENFTFRRVNLLNRQLLLVGERHNTVGSEILNHLFIHEAADRKIAYFDENLKLNEISQKAIPLLYEADLHLANQQKNGLNYFLENTEWRFLVELVNCYYRLTVNQFFLKHSPLRANFEDLSGTNLLLKLSLFPGVKKHLETLTKYTADLHPKIHLIDIARKVQANAQFMFNPNKLFSLENLQTQELMAISEFVKQISSLLEKLDDIPQFEKELDAFMREYTLEKWKILLKALSIIVLNAFHSRQPLPEEVIRAFNAVFFKYKPFTYGLPDFLNFKDTVIVNGRDELFVDEILAKMQMFPEDLVTACKVGDGHSEGMGSLMEKVDSGMLKKEDLLLSEKWIPTLHRYAK